MSRFAAPIALAVCLAAGLGGCETPTPYQPIVRGHTAAGGYSEVRLEPGRWRVSFSGNSLTSRETVDGYLLFRSAELTLQNGDDWFTLIDRDSRTTSCWDTPTWAVALLWESASTSSTRLPALAST